MPKTRKARKSTSKKALPIKKVLMAALIFILGAIALYSYRAYKTTQIETEGIVVCGKDGVCEKSLHIHSELEVSICGEAKTLAKDEGSLADIHTHKESNLLHFHERLRVDQQGNILDYTPLMLSNAVRAMFEMELTNECLGEFCNGSRCPNGQRGKLGLTVNDEPQEEVADYVWKDGDDMHLTFE